MTAPTAHSIGVDDVRISSALVSREVVGQRVDDDQREGSTVREGDGDEQVGLGERGVDRGPVHVRGHHEEAEAEIAQLLRAGAAQRVEDDPRVAA